MRWLTPEQMLAWRSFLDAHQLLMTRLDRELRTESTLGLTEYTILVRLSESEDRTLRMATLAADTGVSRSRLTHIVARLEDRGIVEREKTDEDRRGVRCKLTDDGFRLLADTAPVHVTGVRTHLIDLLDDEEIDVMAGIFSKVLTHMRALPADARLTVERPTEADA